MGCRICGELVRVLIHIIAELLAELPSSKVRSEIFRNLFGMSQDALHLRELERRSGLTVGTVQQEVRKLLSLDLIIRIKDGNRIYYKANTDHPLFPDIKNLVLKTNGLVDVIKDALSEERSIRSAFIFGSIAKKEEKAKSDVDIMIIGEVGLRKIRGLLSKAALKIGREINPHTFTEQEFVKRKKEKDHFLKQVLGSPKLFIIGTEDELKKVG